VPLEEMADIYIQAALSTEDSDFYSHGGIDYFAMLRAIFNKGESGGGSTITMQLAKLIYLMPVVETNCEIIEEENLCTDTKIDPRSDGPLKYKVDQMLLASQIESKYTKDQILEYYLNIVYFGSGIYGVENASRHFFDTTASDLTTAQASLLAGIPQKPNGNNPYKNPEDAKSRQVIVLNGMLRDEVIVQEEYDQIKNMAMEEIILAEPVSTNYQVYSGYIDLIYRSLKAEFGNDFDVSNSGIEVYSNIDSKAQELTYNILNSDDYILYPDELMQAGAVMLDSQTGAVRAVGNGRNYESTLGVNYAINYPRQPGSSAKPIVAYAPVIEFLD